MTASQACGQTPLKVNHPSKYEFNSPLKALETEQKNKRGGYKNRKSLNFGESKADSIIRGAHPNLEEKFNKSSSDHSAFSTPTNLKLNSGLVI